MPFRGRRCSRPTGTFLGAGPPPRTWVHYSPTSPACFKSTNASTSEHNSRVQAARLAAWPSTPPRIPTTAQYHEEPNVDPDSLRNTLEAHRAANRSSLIVKVAGKGSARQKIDLPPRLTRKAWPSSEIAAGKRAWHIDSACGRGERRAIRSAKPHPPIKEEFLAQWAPNSGLRYTEKYPWMRYMKAHDQPDEAGRRSGIGKLSREIEAFYLYSQPTAPEKQVAELALQEISTAIEQVDQSIKVGVVGSHATGLALPMSDIDLNISTSSTSSSRKQMQDVLQKVASYLRKDSRKKGLFRSVSTRFRPKVPLVTGRHASTNLEIQVQSTIDSFLSLPQTLSFINEFPTLPKLFVVLKQMLAMRGLNIGSEQGISSYPLLVMIAAALKFSEGKFDCRDVGSHLLFFLEMYSEVDFATTAISFAPLQYIVKRHPHSATLPRTQSAVPNFDDFAASENDNDYEHREVDARRRFATIKPDAEFLMCLQDPADLQNDLGKSAYRIREVQTIFIRSREHLKAAMEAWDNAEGEQEQGPLLASCIGGDYRIFENMRHALASSATRRRGDLSASG